MLRGIEPDKFDTQGDEDRDERVRLRCCASKVAHRFIGVCLLPVEGLYIGSTLQPIDFERRTSEMLPQATSELLRFSSCTCMCNLG